MLRHVTTVDLSLLRLIQYVTRLSARTKYGEHAAPCCAGERLDQKDPHAPFGATGKDAEGNPIASPDGKEADPLALAGVDVKSKPAADNDSGLGDGSLTDALRVLSEVRREGAGV